MRTIELKLYSFEELSEEAKETAIQNYRNKGIDTSHYWNDAHKSVQEFHKVFGTTEGNRSWLEFYTGHIEDNILELKGLRLRTYLINNFGSQIFTPKYLKTGERTHNEPGRHRMRRIRKTDYDPQNKGKYYSQYYSNIQKSTDDCPFTGVCYDYDLLNPFYQFINNYRNTPSADYQTFEDLIKEAFEGLEKSLKDEDEYRYSDEGITEEILAGDYEFTEDGETL